MKVPDKVKNKKEKVKKKSGVNKPKPKKEQVLVVAQEIKYARWLSGNDKKTRDRVLKALKKWILNCFEKGYEFKEEDFTRVWKGLFYAVWMSDKPLIQEELCENISAVLDLFPPNELKHALLMTKAGFKMLATEWYGIDSHRMDKFLMMVRRYLRGSLRCLARCEWSVPSCQEYAKMLSGGDGLFALKIPHYARNATSMLLHITDCFLEELAKVSQGRISGESVAALLRPFVQYTCSGTVLTLCTAARRVLTALLRQSDIGLQYEEKTRAWKQMGCPTGGPDALEPVSDDEEQETTQHGDHESDGDDDSEKALDPRAGRVDVELPLLPVPASMLADMLRDMLASASSKAHRRVKICLQRFESLSAGQYPLPVSVPEPAVHEGAPRPRRAAHALHQLEHKLRADADELKLRGLSRKHRKRLLKKSRAGLSIVEDVDSLNKSLSNHSNNGEWLVEPTEGKVNAEKDTSDKENQEKPKKNKIAQKRKNDTQLNGDVNKKAKLDKSSSDNKKNNLGNKIIKKDKVKQNKSAEEQKINKQNVKSKESKNSIKNEAKDLKTRKAKNQPQIISDKSEKHKTEISKEKSSKIENTKREKEGAKLNKIEKKTPKPTVLVNKVKNFQKQFSGKDKKEKKDLPNKKNVYNSPKKVKFELKKNSMQKPVDYYKSVRQSPNIPFDGTKKPSKTNLKPSIPSPINPFFKKKLRMKH